jgi:hypothetical protein
MRDWNDVLPPDVALMQNADERRRTIARAVAAGASLKEIAVRMHRHPERVRQLRLHALRRREIPIERWFHEQGDIRKLFEMAMLMR